ncbi:MAG: hypothetical protein ACO23H_06195 [Alphaproteobacteria bacterium]
MNYQQALAFMSKAKDISKGRPTGQRGTRMHYHFNPVPDVSLSYHGTELICWTHEGIYFRNGGWKTATTKKRLNEHLLPHRMYITQRKFVWYLCSFDSDKEYPLDSAFIIKMTNDGVYLPKQKKKLFQ